MIKDTLRTSRNVSSLTDFQFRLWVLLITYVDDFGRGSADAELLKGLLFPRRHGVTVKQIQDAIGTLANKGMINLYESDGESFFYFPKWGEHQRIRAKVPKFPEPAADCGGLRRVAADCSEARPETKPNQEETKRETEEKNNPVPTAHAHARENPDLGRVMAFFLDRINPAPSPTCIDLLRQYTDSLSADVVLHALEIAIDERKTAWSYIQAILSQYERDGVRDMDGVKRREQERQQRRETAAPPARRMSKSEEFAAAGRNQERTLGELDKLLAGLDKI
jgi:DnaD/phage-associated family protein